MTLPEALFLIAVIGMIFGVVWIAFRIPFTMFIAMMMATVYFTGNLNQYIPHRFWW